MQLNDFIERPLVLIPARGGSKGIPGKNIKPLGGVPLVARTINAALEAFGCSAPLCLSTDSEEIRNVGMKYGAEAPFLRPAELAADDTPTRDVILHALDFYAARGYDADCVVLLQPTSPFRTAPQIVEAVSLYRPDIDMVVSVSPSTANPYYDIFETDSEGLLRISKGEGLFTRRQQAPQVWQYNGAIYVIKADSLRRMPMGAFRARLPYVMDRLTSLDIDTPLDWEMAEAMIRSGSVK